MTTVSEISRGSGAGTRIPKEKPEGVSSGGDGSLTRQDRTDISGGNNRSPAASFVITNDAGKTLFSGVYGIDLSGKRLKRANLSGKALCGAKLAGADLRKARLDWADLRGAILAGADLSGADMTGALLDGANLTNVILRRANLTKARLAGADLSGASMTGTNLDGANLTDVRLNGADMSGSTWAEAYFMQDGKKQPVTREFLEKCGASL